MMMLAMVMVVLTTDLGKIELQLDQAHAPLTTANFLQYVSDKFYDGGAFFRTVTDANQRLDKVKIAVIQATANPAKQETDGPIKLERTSVTGLKHKDGTLSMARDAPDSATLDFFICIGDQPELDFGGKRNPDGQGFAAFGKVVSGMDVVRKIHQSKANGQKLIPPIKIIRAEIR
jgi:peptidyl-prolyl cis-trans isomerase A (cyclophilin A)